MRALSLLIALAAAVPALAEEASIASHRATYSMTDESGSPTGRMEVELLGDACRGYAMLRRLEIDNDFGKVVRTSATWESADGKSYSFNDTLEQDGTEIKSFRGKAERENDATVVRIVAPEEQRAELPANVLFPISRTKALRSAIDISGPGAIMKSMPAYLGAPGFGTKAAQVSTIVQPRRPDPGDLGALQGLKSWHTREAFFVGEAFQDAGPSFEMKATEFENGVVAGFEVIEGERISRGRIEKLELIHAQPCKG
ncbi:ATP/GTP-binding site motif A [Hyphomicrobiales bacterium]|jgi:hypothetical protein|nr:ATP/GTP-binding site motif A [Hyphomicrobiales bacterium]CAH1702345.1 ATP/GTP-binding site motif A [Hyphomicrobiales bacterium]CAI0346546.1 conserved exported hypothetical protein [Hyphomicrobiales bacterium]